MATLTVTEFTGLAINGRGGLSEVCPLPPLAEQIKAITSASSQTTAVGSTTRLVRLHTDTACRIAFGANPTATGTSLPLLANSVEYFHVDLNSGNKFAVIGGF